MTAVTAVTAVATPPPPERRAGVRRKPHTYGRTDCCIVGCPNEAVHGLCEPCRDRFWLRRGLSERRTPGQCLAFLRARCRMVGDDDPCWDPDALSINDKGYVWVSFMGQRKVRAHRLAWRLQHVIDGGRWSDLRHWDYVLHSPLCERRYACGATENKCWNPAHLRVGSGEENMAEQWALRRELDPFLGRRTGERCADPCRTEGCERTIRAKGLCDTCYHRARRARLRAAAAAAAAAAPREV